jgi:hypothetical protein
MWSMHEAKEPMQDMVDLERRITCICVVIGDRDADRGNTLMLEPIVHPIFGF